MQKGKLVKWFDEKGYGFIRPNSGGDDVFLHIRNVISHTKRAPRPGDTIIFDVETDEQGRKRAITASLKGLTLSGFTVFAILAALVFIAYIGLVFGRILPLHPVAAVYAGMSIVTIWAYSRDKRAAQLGRWRTKEIQLHALELFGGWPGAFLAQRFYRHKNRKPSYQIAFWSIVLVHGVLWYQVFAPSPWGIPYAPSSQQIRQFVTDVTAWLPTDFKLTAPDTMFQAPQQSVNPQSHPAEISCPDRRGNVNVLTGTITSIDLRAGLRVRFSATSDGIIPLSALPADFAQTFRKGRQICVSIQQARIENNRKFYTLELIE